MRALESILGSLSIIVIGVAILGLEGYMILRYVMPSWRERRRHPPENPAYQDFEVDLGPIHIHSAKPPESKEGTP